MLLSRLTSQRPVNRKAYKAWIVSVLVLGVTGVILGIVSQFIPDNRPIGLTALAFMAAFAVWLPVGMILIGFFPGVTTAEKDPA